MKKQDLLQVQYTEEDLNLVEDGLAKLENFAKKYAPNLSAKDRIIFSAINETNKLFVNKSKTLMEQNSNLLPSFVNIEEFNRDFIARKKLEDILLRIDRAIRNISDTKILLDYDNYHNALAFYRAIRYLANEQQDGAIAIYNQLKIYFPNNKKKTEKLNNPPKEE